MADFVRILPSPTHPNVRLRLVQIAPGLITLHEERVADQVFDPNVEALDRKTVELHGLDVSWLRDQLSELLGEVADTYALQEEIEKLRAVKAVPGHPDAVLVQTLRDQVTLLTNANGALQQELELAIGPHCTRCGNAIDPDMCHCGDYVKQHDPQQDGHMAVPMGCTCGYADPDWKQLAKTRGELLWQKCRELDRLKTAVPKEADHG